MTWLIIPLLVGFFAGKVMCEQTSEDSEVDDAPD